MLTPLVAFGCGAGWHRIQPMDAPLAARQQVQVWHGGTVERWHAVSVQADSLVGVPYHMPVECDSCRAALARSAVDSIRAGNPTAAFWKTTGLVVGLTLGVLVVYCVAKAHGSSCDPR